MNFMTQRARVLFTVSIALSVLLSLGSTVRAQGSGDGKNPFTGDTEAIAVGKLIFEATCAGYCHATEGSARQGRCPNLFDCEWKYGSSDSEVFHSVSAGIPRTEMVGFKGKLPDDVLWKIVAYVRSVSQCKEGKPAAAAAH